MILIGSLLTFLFFRVLFCLYSSIQFGFYLRRRILRPSGNTIQNTHIEPAPSMIWVSFQMLDLMLKDLGGDRHDKNIPSSLRICPILSFIFIPSGRSLSGCGGSVWEPVRVGLKFELQRSGHFSTVMSKADISSMDCPLFIR